MALSGHVPCGLTEHVIGVVGYGCAMGLALSGVCLLDALQVHILDILDDLVLDWLLASLCICGIPSMVIIL